MWLCDAFCSFIQWTAGVTTGFVLRIDCIVVE